MSILSSTNTGLKPAAEKFLIDTGYSGDILENDGKVCIKLKHKSSLPFSGSNYKIDMETVPCKLIIPPDSEVQMFNVDEDNIKKISNQSPLLLSRFFIYNSFIKNIEEFIHLRPEFINCKIFITEELLKKDETYGLWKQLNLENARDFFVNYLGKLNHNNTIDVEIPEFLIHEKLGVGRGLLTVREPMYFRETEFVSWEEAAYCLGIIKEGHSFRDTNNIIFY